MFKYPAQIKQKAILLRKKGGSVKQIAKILGIAKSTSALWLQNVLMSKNGIQKIDKRSKEARQRGALTRKHNLECAYNQIENAVKNELISYIPDITTRRILCSYLYWAEGGKTKRSIKFMNSDPAMIKIFLNLFRESFGLEERKFSATLHLHQYHNVKERLIFWSKISKIPINRIGIYNKPNSGINIREGYPGCICINYFDSKMFVALTSYYKNFKIPNGGVV